MRFLSWIWPRRWWQWSILTLAAALLTFVILLPRFLQGAIETQLAQATTARVRVADVDLHFWRHALTVHDIVLTLPGEEQPLLSVRRLIGSIQLSALLLRREVVIEEIRLVGVHIAAVLQKDGHFNLAKLFPPSPPGAPPSDLPTLTIGRVHLADVQATYLDLARTAKERFSLTLHELTTGPILLQPEGMVEPISLRWNGGLNQGALKGSAQIFWQRSQTQVDAQVDLRRISLALTEPYLHDIFTLQKITGQTDSQLRYQYKSNSTQTLMHALSGTVALNQVILTDAPTRPPALQLSDGSVEVEMVDFLTREVRLPTVELRNLNLFVLQNGGESNWTALLSPRGEGKLPQPQAQNEESGWRYVIPVIRVHGGEVVFRDDSWPETEIVKVVPTQLEVRQVQSDAQEMPMRFRLGVGAGQVAGEGTLHRAPFGIDARMSLSELWLSPLQPLFVHAAQIKQADAVLNGSLHTDLRVNDGLPHLRVEGTLDAAAFSATGLSTPEGALGWKRAQLEISAGSTLLPTLDAGVRGQITNVAFSNFPQSDVSIESVDADLQLTRENSSDASAIQPVQNVGEGAAEVSVQGRVGVKGFLVRQGPDNTEVLSCYQARAELQEGSHVVPFDLRFAEVALEYPYGQGFRTKDGVLQLAKPLPTTDKAKALPTSAEDASQTPTEQGSQTATPAPAVSPLLQLDHVSLIGGQLYFEDHAVTPPQTIYWQDIRVDLNGAGYPLVRPTAFTLHAYNMDGAPIEATGATKKQGKQLVTEVQGTIDRLTISRFNVYLAPQLGYRVRQGSISVKWRLMMPGDVLHADASVTLHNFGLGGKESASGLEEQVGLPMHLIVALLKDLNGNINLQLPVEGRINEPGFRLDGTIWRAIRDVLVGAVTSPLKLLGAFFRKENSLQDFALNPISFEPGASRPDAAGVEQLARLKLFLSQRPEVDLRLSGSSGAEDVLVRQEQMILARLQSGMPDSSQSETSATEQENTTVDAPSEEVRAFLIHRLNATKKEHPPPLSDQAAALLAQLRKETTPDPRELQQLAQERTQVVIAALTEGAAVSTNRLHVSPKRVRGRDEPEVQYVIEAREEQQSGSRKTDSSPQNK